MRIEAILVGKARPIQYQGQEHLTGIFKSEVAGPVTVSKTTLAGDEQADPRYHGGIDKALYAYGLDAYTAWRALRPQDNFGPGAMGENLAVDTLPESQIFIGDKYKLGSTVIEVSEPRFPCFKLGVKFSDASIVKQFMQVERPGVYFRVLTEGSIQKGDTLQLIDREPTHVSILEIFQLKTAPQRNKPRLEEILKVQALTTEWRKKIQSYL